MNELILIKYGELTTKKANRKLFINLLASNIKKILKNYEIKLEYDRVRMYIETNNTKEVVEKIKNVFGIHSIVICHKVNTNNESIKEKVLELLKDKCFKTFKVNTKRADKSFEIPSMEFNNVIGGLVLRNYNCKVDVHNPELIINIEIRNELKNAKRELEGPLYKIAKKIAHLFLKY